MIERLECRRVLSVPPVTGFTLLNADADRPVAGYESFANGAVLNLATLPTRNLSVRANVAASPGSVRLKLDGNAIFTTENFAPYVLLGDNGGDVRPWTPAVGSHTLTATPYQWRGGAGERGETESVTFTVVDRPQPVGGRTIVVDPAGDVKTIGAAAQLARPGDLVLINPGRYRESITLPRSGTASAPITFAAKTPGTVSIGGEGLTYLLRGNVSYVGLQGLTFDGCSNGLWEPAVQVFGGWKVTDVTVRNCDGPGITVYGTGARLTRVTAEYNGQTGLGGSNCADVYVKDCVTRFNNRGKAEPVWAGAEHTLKVNGLWHVEPTWEGGAGKWSNTRGVMIDGLRSHANGGPGLWFDYNNSDVVIRNSTVYDNRAVRYAYEAAGINLELTKGGVLVEKNHCYNNPGGNLVFESSRNATVQYNTFSDGAVILSDWDRGADYRVGALRFTRNKFDNARIETWGEDWHAGSGGDRDIDFDGNTYADFNGRPLFRWGGADYATLDAVRRRLGFESWGTLSG